MTKSKKKSDDLDADIRTAKVRIVMTAWSETGTRLEMKFGSQYSGTCKSAYLGAIRELARLAALDGYGSEAVEKAKEANTAVIEWREAQNKNEL